MSFTVRLAEPARLVDVVKAHLVVVPVGEIGDLIKEGAIRIGARTGAIAARVDDGDVLSADADAIAPRALAAEPGEIVVRYEDEDLILCDKPAGRHVHPLGAFRTGTLLNQLLWHAGARADEPWAAWRPSPLHRLDRAASGLVAFAKSARIHDAVRRMLVAHDLERRYLALVEGRVQGEAGTIDAPLGRDPALDYRRAVVPGGQHAVTHWRVVERRAAHTLLAITLETGRTHQIRAHLASIGHPIAGDRLYAEGCDAAPAIALHAAELRFRHPRTNAEIVVRAPPPARLG